MGVFVGKQFDFAGGVIFRVGYGASQLRGLRKYRVNLYHRRTHQYDILIDCRIAYYYSSCHQTMCSMIFNMDHS